MTKNLMTKLKNLNTNIKRYIKRLVQDNMKNDLNQILDSLLSDYVSGGLDLQEVLKQSTTITIFIKVCTTIEVVVN